ncbi:unnamed protein product [Didymodactylos carnosus]|uniref:Transposase n=1 Tax=Didymodactylos carnosus TaxID=1234261 RepID=A0A814K068_9BILA|nr:unnamed protein product [Didymodactylos carnosus]CAF1191754.1 unnamed protein product [Didymodactylos carnosus]CAF3812876.1 unnamed protein product [Didymodactylos carnosus]CAF4002234.1 unnamed protein product [Didymodactylos carnosus]
MHPPTQRAVAKSLHISQSTVSKIIKESGFVLRKKRKVQKLTSANVEKRRQRSRRFYLQLANGRYRNFITTDESWFYLDGTSGKRKVCYIKKSDPNYDRMIIQQDSSRPKGFMVWGGVSSKGKTTLRFVEPGAKVNSQYYINKILKPFLSRDVPRLFPIGGKTRPTLQQDSAPSHVSKETIAFLENTAYFGATGSGVIPVMSHNTTDSDAAKFSKIPVQSSSTESSMNPKSKLTFGTNKTSINTLFSLPSSLHEITPSLNQTPIDLRKAIMENMIKNPKTFSGEKENMHKWLEDLETQFDTGDIPDNNKFSIIFYQLKGEALSWFKDNKQTILTRKDFADEFASLLGLLVPW